MTREQKLRNLILDRYKSLRQFALEADIPYSTLMTLSGSHGAAEDFGVPPWNPPLPSWCR